MASNENESVFDSPLLGELAVERGLLSRAQLEECLRELAGQPPGTRLPLGQLLIKRHLLTPVQLVDLIKEQTSRRAQAPGTCIGSYEVLRELGRGGMGVVFLARDPKLNRQVALKVLRLIDESSETAVQRFLREARTVASLSHPNIVQVYEIGTDRGMHYFAMQYVDGAPLSALLAERRLPLRDAVALLEKVARAVHYAHEHGIVHRDLKPANIMVDAAGNPFITDFGLARSLDAHIRLTRSGGIVGTPFYMAPEIVAGSPSVDGRVDVYALGVILYEMITGSLPFEGRTEVEVYRKILEFEPLRPRSLRFDLDADLETVCLKALEKAPADRYPNAQAFADDLRRYLADEPVQARPCSSLTRMLRRWRRHSLRVGVMALIVAVAAAAAVWLEHRRRVDSQLRARIETELEVINRWDVAVSRPGTVLADLYPELRSVVARVDPLIARHPRFASGFYVRGKTYRRLREFRHALEDLSRAVELSPDDPFYRFERARTAFDAFSEVALSIELRPSMAAVLGTNWKDLMDQLRTDLTRARGTGRLKDWELDWCAAVIGLIDDRMDEVIDITTRAIEKAKNEPDLYFLRGLACNYKAGRAEASRAEFSEFFRRSAEDGAKALSLQPSFYGAAVLVGWACFCRSQEETMPETDRHEILRAGFRAMDQAISIDPDRGWAHYLLGHMFFWSSRNGHTPLTEQESLERSAAAFERACSAQSWNHFAPLYHSYVAARSRREDSEIVSLLGRAQEAFLRIEREVRSCEEEYHRFIGGWTYWQLGRRAPSQAVPLLQRAHELLQDCLRDNVNPGLFAEYATALIFETEDHLRVAPDKRLKSSAADLILLRAHDKTPEARACRGVARLWKGDLKGARADLQQALEQNPGLSRRFQPYLAEACRE